MNNYVLQDENDNFGIKCGSDKETQLAIYYKDKIQFALISRKHSVGFIEFVRGRYELDNVNGIMYLFRQMIQEEFEKIKNAATSDDLWKDVWIHDSNNYRHIEEYKRSKDKFNNLKHGTECVNLEFYLTKVKPLWKIQEWGFPKGRKDVNEHDKACGEREFKEETGLKNEDFVILDSIEPFVENLVGTDGKNYRHIYYLAVVHNNDALNIDKNNSFQQEEIGDIGYYSYDDSIKLIRPYHSDRRKILTMIYIHVVNLLTNIVSK